MTRQETGVIMDILATAYPRFYTGSTAPDRLRTMDLWAAMFADEPLGAVAAAVKAYIATDEKGFPPHIGAIKNQLYRLTDGGLDEADAWTMVKRAISNGVYGAGEEFARLPEAVRRVVGSPSQLRDWALMDSETVNSVVQSNFLRAWRAKTERRRTEALLPGDVRKAIAGYMAGIRGLEAGYEI